METISEDKGKHQTTKPGYVGVGTRVGVCRGRCMGARTQFGLVWFGRHPARGPVSCSAR